MAVNAPIQGTAADIIKKATIAIDAALEKENLKNKAHLMLQVHDELIYEVEENSADKISVLIKKEMEGVLNEKIPFEASISKGKNWGEI